jgi:hypothetical protein
MDAGLARRLEELKRDHQVVTGKPFEHFTCPLLFRDEPAPLCRGHIVPEAFGPGPWTVQRADVDSFFGSLFEAQFADMRHRDATPDVALSDKTLARTLRPRFEVDGRVIEHYPTSGPVPSHHSSITLVTPLGPKTFGLKIPPDELASLKVGRWQTVIEHDMRLSAFVSLLKAAHLTLFERTGYGYALSPSGRFLGGEVLGAFYEANAKLTVREEVLKNARRHFRRFATMMRPVQSDGLPFGGTAVDGTLFLSKLDGPGTVVLMRVGADLHAVLVPNFTDPEGRTRFDEFLQHPRDFDVTAARYIGGGRFERTARHLTTMHWPNEGMLYPDD